MTYYWSFDKSSTSGVVGWVETVYPFVIVNDDVVLSFSFSVANILHYQIMHTFLLHMHNNRHTLVFNLFNRCKCLTYLWTFVILELIVLTTYVKLERRWFLTRKTICYGVLSPFAPISMQYRYSLNKKQR